MVHADANRFAGWGMLIAAGSLVALAATRADAQRCCPTKMKPARAESLYVRADPEDHPASGFDAQVKRKAQTDTTFHAKAQGVMDYRKIVVKSRIGDGEVPMYRYQPLAERAPHAHAAMVWIHGGVHGDLSEGAWPFVKEAIDRGYVIIAPAYRGSTGYGRAYYNAIDYGGYELDDVLTAVDYLKTLPHVDPDRIG